MADNVNRPAHYMAGGIETIDFIAAKLGAAGFRAYCVGNALKYLSRWDKKNGTEDLAKAEVYIGWALRGRAPQGIVPHALAAARHVPPPPSNAFDDPEPWKRVPWLTDFPESVPPGVRWVGLDVAGGFYGYAKEPHLQLSGFYRPADGEPSPVMLGALGPGCTTASPRLKCYARDEAVAQAVHDAIEGEVGLVPGCPGGVCGVAE